MFKFAEGYRSGDDKIPKQIERYWELRNKILNSSYDSGTPEDRSELEAIYRALPVVYQQEIQKRLLESI